MKKVVVSKEIGVIAEGNMAAARHSCRYIRFVCDSRLLELRLTLFVERKLFNFNSINRTEQRVTILLIEGAACLIRSHVLVHLFTHLQTTAYGACAETFVSAVLSVLLIAVKLL